MTYLIITKEHITSFNMRNPEGWNDEEIKKYILNKYKDIKEEDIEFFGKKSKYKTIAKNKIKEIIKNSGDLMNQEDLFELQELINFI